LVLERRLRGGPARESDRQSRAGILGAMGLAFSLAWPVASLGWPAVAGDNPALRGGLHYAGLGLMAAGLAFRYWAIRTLGRYFAPDVSLEAGHRLVEAGPYRLVRHPSYTGTFITILGYGLALTNWLSLGIMLVIPGLAYAFRIHVEERALLAAFGESYRAYMRRTRRIIPFIL
jgi:protein-S-isoprenylcysteine O-methyltransferase Ste14